MWLVLLWYKTINRCPKNILTQLNIPHEYWHININTILAEQSKHQIKWLYQDQVEFFRGIYCCFIIWESINVITMLIESSQVALVVKNLTANAGNVKDVGSIPGWGRSPWEGNDNPLVCLPGESHGQKNLVGYSPWDPKESDRSSHAY